MDSYVNWYRHVLYLVGYRQTLFYFAANVKFFYKYEPKTVTEVAGQVSLSTALPRRSCSLTKITIHQHVLMILL